MKQLMLFTMFVAAPMVLLGAPLTGTLTVAGASGQLVAVGPCTTGPAGFCIDFDWTGTSTSTPPKTVTGGAVDGTGDTALFDTNASFFTANGGVASQAVIADLNSTTEPTGAPISIPGFITFPLDSTWSVTLTEVLPGSDTASATCQAQSLTPGQSCTPLGTPFNEQNQGTCTSASNCSAVISFLFNGTATNGTNTSQVSGTFSTTFTGTDYQIIDSDIASNLDVVTSDSGTVNFTFSSVPEPMTSGMIGIGLTLLGVLGRKRRMNQ